MKRKQDLKPGLDFRYPNSGVAFGVLVGALRLKHALYAGETEKSAFCSDLADYKRMQDWFKGERIKPEYIVEYLKSFVDRCVPENFRWQETGGEMGRVGPLVRAVVECESVHWDHVTFRLNMLQHEDEQVGDAVYAALRLYAWDAGIRAGAFMALREFQTRTAPDWDLLEVDRLALKRWMAKRCKKLDLTLEELRSGFGKKLSVTGLADWRSGKTLPSPENLVRLARALTLPGEKPELVELELRLLVGAMDVRRQLTGVIESPDIPLSVADLFDGVLSTARHAHAFFRAPPPLGPLANFDLDAVAEQVRLEKSMPEWLPALLTQVVVEGAACDAGMNCANFLAGVARTRPQVALDYKALAGDWQRRIGFWRQHLARSRMKVRLIGKSDALNAARRQLATAFTWQELARDARMSAIDEPLGPRIVETVPTDANEPSRVARELLRLARDAYSTRDWDRLYWLLTEAARVDPKDASTHFKLGYELLRRGLLAGEDGLVAAALHEMGIALSLDPTDQNLCTEFGAVLLTLTRFADAEAWFESVEGNCASHSSFWVARGRNYLALDRYPEAEVAFRKALQFDPGQVDAKGMLVVALMAQGGSPEATRLAKEVKHVMHADPARDWRDVIEFCKGRRRTAA